MNGYQPKKTCDYCLRLYICNKIRRDKEACEKFKPCLPPPPPNTGSSVVKPPRENQSKMKTVIVKVNGIYREEDLERIREKLIEQARTGLVVVDDRFEILEVEDITMKG